MRFRRKQNNGYTRHRYDSTRWCVLRVKSTLFGWSFHGCWGTTKKCQPAKQKCNSAVESCAFAECWRLKRFLSISLRNAIEWVCIIIATYRPTDRPHRRNVLKEARTNIADCSFTVVVPAFSPSEFVNRCIAQWVPWSQVAVDNCWFEFQDLTATEKNESLLLYANVTV